VALIVTAAARFLVPFFVTDQGESLTAQDQSGMLKQIGVPAGERPHRLTGEARLAAEEGTSWTFA
jgi:hypothetical protein